MKLAAEKIVTKLLNVVQQQRRMYIAQEMLTTIQTKKVITGDESWVHGDDSETKAYPMPSSQWKLPEEPIPKNAHQVRSNVKGLHTVFFDCNGVVHHEFLPLDRTVNKKYYLEVMCRLRKAIHQKHTELWKNQSWIFHHDNGSAHTSMLVREFLTKYKTVIMAQAVFTGLDPR